ncbi:LLM class flavin-dependent oxidoreductase [Paenibacillus ehimensis]|uniref:LLM class flavin-dependent oxidoreductase n=1 Tax=Paenibacillus ehimensis TaxID=79264 RepID=A0ABT8V6W6_9BACL|nr:LLM class flavin-dependent oxidoreductase [Paenibacillus ehimensis]MDO3676488.1 LLM class flavin-dependent oxidoreductase [Paenibacillus ehimensis]MEC0208386.1 LLM class flavin-dependent oxidoreductase [Paenibacillus ehimensis]
MKPAQRQMHLNLFVLNTGHHEASWRHPETHPESITDIRYYTKLAQTAESAKLDSLFIADALVLTPAVKYKILGGLEPLTLLSALAMGTERIGLIATVSTTYSEPFNVARMFSSLDHISGGRAGWNSVTSVGDATALNFGLERHPEHGDRYERAKEFLVVLKGLWDCWQDDAIVANKQTGIYSDYEHKIRALDHKGKHYSVRGPLNIGRSPQGYPVLVQAGSSDAGKELAAETAEVVFTAQDTLEHGRSFYADVKQRMSKYGRSPDELKILPGFCPIVGITETEAREKEALLNELTLPAFGLIRLSNALEMDLSQYPLDGPFPLEDLPSVDQVKGQKARFQMYVEMVRKENLTIRQLMLRTASARGHYTLAGTPKQIADEMEAWFTQEAADGFNVMPPYFPGGFEDFVNLVVPELQRRGLFRTEYTGRTLREHLGLKRPAAKNPQPIR